MSCGCGGNKVYVKGERGPQGAKGPKGDDAINIIQGSSALTVSSSDVWIGNLSVTPSAYVDRGLYLLRAPATNVGTAPTINLDGEGAIPITTKTGAPLAIGQILDSGWYLFMFSSANRFLLITG